MSRVSQGSINDIAYLYEEINIQQNDFLNEESDYYDVEASEMVDDILSTISTMMVYEGYSAEGIIGFLADSSEDLILEKYLSFDENILSESNVSEEYIVEQLIIFDAAINEGIVLSGLGKLAKGAVGLVGRIASKPARMKVGSKLMQSNDPAKTAAALEKLTARKLTKAGLDPDLVKNAPSYGSKVRMGVTAPFKGAVSKAIGKVKNIASKAKAVLTGPTAKKLGLGALGAGALVGLPYVGAKLALAGAGEGLQGGLKTPPPKDDFLQGSALAKLGGREGRIKGGEFRTMKWSPESRSRYAAATAKPPAPAPSPAPSSTPSGGGGEGAGTPSGAGAGRNASRRNASQPSGQTGDKARDMETWARANPEAASRVKPGQSGYDVISRLRDKPGPSEKQDQTPTQGSPTAQIDPASVQKAIDAENERLKKKLEQKNQSSSTPTNESYEPYDIVLEYLITEGHADSIDEANYIMLEMDETAVQTIMENYENFRLAEEVSEWVNNLIDEGYDLSDYTWDEIVEYYVTEAY